MKETLEQAAKLEAFEFSVDYKPFETDLDYREYAQYGFEKGFIEGAKYQAERMYNEEEVIELLHSRIRYTLGEDYKEVTTIEWFEQFKKKQDQ